MMGHTDIRLSDLLSYDPESGRLLWLARRPEHFLGVGKITAEHRCAMWNARWAGAPALDCVATDTGYRVGSLLGKRAYAHRIAYMLMKGRMPPGQIDHVNGDRADNRWSNLRLVRPAEQQKNMKLRSDNSSGHHGVCKGRKGWRARVHVNGRDRHLGEFASKEEAVAARRAAERALGFHPNHGRN